MLQAAVFSDTHGTSARMVEAVRLSRPDLVIHLGDCVRDTLPLREAFPALPLYSVCGNCDFAHSAPEKLVIELGPVKALLTHGHLYNVKFYVDSLVYAAQEEGAKLALFGHTHEALNVEIGGVQLLNPGAAGRGRAPSWGWVTVFDNGGIACEVRRFE